MNIREIHGWKVEFLEHPPGEPDENKRKPYVYLSKGAEWVKVMGRPGIDPEILLERAVIEALRKDLAVAEPRSKEREKVAKLLQRAIKDEQVSQELRRDAMLAAAQEQR